MPGQPAARRAAHAPSPAVVAPAQLDQAQLQARRKEVAGAISSLPDVDRAILRMAVFELLWADDVPDPVVIDEAVELAKSLSTDDSPAFVNGVLGAIAEATV